MAETWTMKQHDRYPPMPAIVEDQNGIVNLTAAVKVYFVMKEEKENVLVEGECAVSEATGGKVEYHWGVEDTKTVGTYKAELKVEWSESRFESFPSATYNTVNILASLDSK